MDGIRALADKAAEQIGKYPVITGKEKMKRLIRGSILRQKLAPADRFSWPNAMLGEGLLTAFEATGERKYLLAVTDHLKRWESAGFPIHYVDNIMNGSLALWIERLLAQADEEQLNAARKKELTALCGSAAGACAEWVKRAPKTQQGLLVYRAQHPDWLFADTLGMVCPFLCQYGARKNEEELFALGIGQLQAFLKRGMDERTGLPYHGYDEKTGMKYGIVGWGRACGWLMKGLVGSLPWIPADCTEYPGLEAAFVALAEAVFLYQRADGGFSWQLPALEGHRDSSAEGMIGAAVAAGIRAGVFGRKEGKEGGTGSSAEELLPCLKSALEQSVSDGVVRDCSGECAAFAEYPQVYGSYPWGTGSALELLAGCAGRSAAEKDARTGRAGRNGR